MSLTPESLPPGLPPTMTVRLTDWPLEERLPEFALWVAPVGRPGFFAASTDRVTPASRELGAGTITRENGTIVLESKVTIGLQNVPWFADSRLAQPGTYVLQLICGASLRELYGHPNAKLEETPRISVSPPVVFSVSEPRGDDRAVWSKMLELSPDGQWNTTLWPSLGSKVAEFVWNDYPRSTYAPYVAAFYYKKQLATLKRALEMFPDNPLEASQRLEIAERLIDQTTTALGERNRDTVERLAAEVRSELEKVLKSDKANRKIKAKAAERLEFFDDHLESFQKDEQLWKTRPE